jgi:transcription initiation factor TFIID subunit 11
MASPPYTQNYGSAVSPPYPSHAQLPPSRKRPSEMASASPVKRRKPSLMSTGSNLSVHPLRQTSFPPDSNEQFSSGARSPSVDTMSLVSGSLVGGTGKKKRGRKPKGYEDNASLVGGTAPTAVSGTSGRGRASRGISADEEDDAEDGMDVAIVARTNEEKEKEKRHRAMLVAAFDEDQFRRYECWRSSRLSDAVVRRVNCHDPLLLLQANRSDHQPNTLAIGTSQRNSRCKVRN